MAVKEITREGLKAKLDRGEEVVLIETLGPKYYEDAHLPGAINIPIPRWTRSRPRALKGRRKDSERSREGERGGTPGTAGSGGRS